MDSSTIATFGERVNINGVSILANVLEDQFSTNGLSLPVEGQQVQLVISNEDKERVRLSKGVPVDYRGKRALVADFNITNTTLWRIDLG